MRIYKNKFEPFGEILGCSRSPVYGSVDCNIDGLMVDGLLL
jgi:hypothetical protein